MAMELRQKMKNRSQRYDTNRGRPKHGPSLNMSQYSDDYTY